jgi:imidazolonepropionase-like amidohydrolase
MAPAIQSRRAFLGNALHTPARGRIEFLPAVLIEVNGAGDIEAIHRDSSPQATAVAARHRAAGTLVTLEKSQYLLPGLIDLHVHAPQWPQLGLALDLPLEAWLQAYTFPLEARYGTSSTRAGCTNPWSTDCWRTARRRPCISEPFIWRPPSACGHLSQEVSACAHRPGRDG